MPGPAHLFPTSNQHVHAHVAMQDLELPAVGLGKCREQWSYAGAAPSLLGEGHLCAGACLCSVGCLLFFSENHRGPCAYVRATSRAQVHADSICQQLCCFTSCDVR